jgi:hypothetical protein
MDERLVTQVSKKYESRNPDSQRYDHCTAMIRKACSMHAFVECFRSAFSGSTPQTSQQVERPRYSIHPCLNTAPIVLLSSTNGMGELQI